MTLRSMTGFGRATRRTPRGEYVVEIRSLNSRFLDLNFRLPSGMVWAEPAFRTLLQKTLSRGKVDCWFQWEPAEDIVPAPRILMPVLQRLVEDVSELRRRRPGLAPLNLGDLLKLPGVIQEASPSDLSPDLSHAIYDDLEGTLRDALTGLLETRTREGGALVAALTVHHQTLSQALEAVAQVKHLVVERYRDRLRQRITELLRGSDVPVDPGRLELEVALYADKSDISEEIDRLRAHLVSFTDLVEKDGEAVGRSLDFLAQEMLREANTIGSKTRDLDAATQVLAMKTAIESIKEQILNVE